MQFSGDDVDVLHTEPRISVSFLSRVNQHYPLVCETDRGVFIVYFYCNSVYNGYENRSFFLLKNYPMYIAFFKYIMFLPR